MWLNMCATVATIYLLVIAYMLEKIAYTLDKLVLPPLPGVS